MSADLLTETAVLAAADGIVAAFARHDTADYFARFAPEATFVFYTHAERLNSRAEYEALWASWEAESGFKVHRCVSTERKVQLFEGFAVFTHSVETDVEFDGSVDTVLERETVVFTLDAGRWVAMHEHLSPEPAA